MDADLPMPKCIGYEFFEQLRNVIFRADYLKTGTNPSFFSQFFFCILKNRIINLCFGASNTVLAVRKLLLKCCTFIIAERKSPSLEAERSFQVLHHMADNPECLGYLLRGLLTHISSLLHLLQKLNETTLHRSMAALLHNLLKVRCQHRLFVLHIEQHRHAT
jgi:hypothetical protein